MTDEAEPNQTALSDITTGICWGCEHNISTLNLSIISLVNVGNRYVCETCITSRYDKCSDCHEYDLKEDMYYSHRYGNLCKTCYLEDYFTCEDCDEITHTDDMHDGCLCPACSNEDSESDNSALSYISDMPNTAKDFANAKPSKLTKKDSFNVFGIELETILKHSIRDMDKTSYQHFSVVTDGSLSSGGLEFVSCPFKETNFNVMKEEIGYLSDNTYIDTSCGFHVHIYMHDSIVNVANLKKIYLMYYKYEPLLYAMNPPSRKTSNYSRPITQDMNIYKVLKCKSLDQFLTYYYGFVIKRKSSRPKDRYNNKRYYFLNLHSLAIRNTIEIRMHSGTTNFDKIANWIRINQKILQYAVTHTIPQIDKLSYEDFYNKVINDTELNKYIKERQKKFNPMGINYTEARQGEM